MGAAGKGENSGQEQDVQHVSPGESQTLTAVVFSAQHLYTLINVMKP